MPYAILHFENESLPPETRWVVWQWGRRIGMEQAVTSSLRALCERLQVSLNRGQKALKALKAHGMIDATPVPTQGRGRRGYTYQLSPSCREALARLPRQPPVLVPHIEHLTNLPAPENLDVPSEADEAVDPKTRRRLNLPISHQRKTQLTFTNRWVLLVLLAHADENGMVATLSQARLQRLTGLSASRLYSQRNKLMERGVIARYIPGSAKKQRGTPLTGVYLLDLTHRDLAAPAGDDVCVTLLPIQRGQQDDTSLCHYQVTALFELTHAIQRVSFHHRRELYQKYQAAVKVLPRYDYAAPCWDIIRALPRDTNLMARLRAWVHRAAMTYLNAQTTSTSPTRTRSTAPIKAILRDSTGVMDSVDAHQRVALMKALCRLAVYLADELHRLLTVTPDIDMTIPRTYRLIPVFVDHPNAYRSAARTQYWQLRGLPVDPYRRREVVRDTLPCVCVSLTR